MRLFLIWAAPYSQLEQLINKLKEKGHEIPYWVGRYENGRAPDLKGTIFHDHYDAWVCEPAKGVDPSEFPPPGKELIEKMYKTESLVLSMMNKKFDTLCVDERRHIYYNMLRYWDGLLEKYKPEAILFPTFPHTVYNYIIFNLAKLKGIKTIMFESTWVSDRLLTYRDVFQGSIQLQQEILKNKDVNFSVHDLSPDLMDYYKFQTESKNDATPIYTKRFKEQYWGKKNEIIRKSKLALAAIKDGAFFRKVLRYMVKLFKPNLMKEYTSLQIAPNLSENFIYMPLCFQPEATSSPLGDMFVDQILLIETLSYALPKGWVIYVKEHPGQLWLRTGINYSSNRYPGYYRRITALKNVHLVPIETDSYALIDGSKAVAVVTGTAGWEALLRSKPAIVFGYPWYRDFPDLFRVFNPDTAKNALDKITKGYKPDRQKIINYLKSFDNATVHAYIEGMVALQSPLSMKENMKNIADVILAELK